ncbi:MAG: DUF2383 domain-containing protein [Luteolibacter sp.]|uniref:DUF2383 domain-containing protein n=1 Tax=Luteolibacter sp. TaxID=1962973 RepID=UPI003266F088
MNNKDTCIDACNKLLRGEISAIETYTQAIEKCDEQAVLQPIRMIRDEHEKSANVLRQHLSSMGAAPDADSGAWGAFAKAVEGAAALLGNGAAITALIEGERHGISEYEDALENPGVMEDAKSNIRGELLPRLKEHVRTLEVLQKR